MSSTKDEFSLTKLTEKLFESIIQSSNDAIVCKTLDGIVRSWNPAAETIFGYTASEMIGQSMLKIFPEDQISEEEDIISRLSHGEVINSYQTIRKHKSGKLLNVSVTISPVFDDEGNVIAASNIARDISEQTQAQEILWKQANYDALTGLANRDLLMKSLTHEIEMVQQSNNRDSLAILFLDLDHFKEYNDTHGHDFGDELLKHAADILSKTCRNADLIARYAGDEFIILLSGDFPKKELKRFLDRLVSKLNVPYTINGIDCRLSASIGLAMYPDDAESIDDLMKKADEAMYNAKSSGRNQYKFFNEPSGFTQ
ncbi:MAG TPA: diguanylate cyclase [Methylophaga aminisulfidivorans]|uniref:Diguanylate cyclase n=2 Tax=root TaxID=1 RepID=A0A7C1VNQ9_9GAMM|nr:diguanylate cyclase [Methylophaga aminisulfidivorans]